MDFYAYTPTGQQEYTTPGTYTWVCPPGVFEVSVVCIGGGGAGSGAQTSPPGGSTVSGGGGGGLGYKNNYTVTPGSS